MVHHRDNLSGQLTGRLSRMIWRGTAERHRERDDGQHESAITSRAWRYLTVTEARIAAAVDCMQLTRVIDTLADGD